MQGLKEKADRPQEVLKAILDWTGGQPFLTQKLCQLASESPFTISTGNESSLITSLASSRIIKNWEVQDEKQHLKTIRNRILSREQWRSRLLDLYQQILQKGAIPAADSPDQLELRITGLVVSREETLQVYNPIYQAIFDLNWVEQELAKLRPYSEPLAAWVDSGKQDPSRLLRGQALQDALAWKADKSLSREDEEFLDASQQEERQAVQQALEAEAEAKRILARANQTLEDANRKAKRRILLGSVILGLTLMGAISSFLLAQHWRSEASAARVKNKRLSQQVNLAQKNLRLAESKQRSAEEKEEEANQNLEVAQKRLDVANQQVEVAKVQANQADRDRQEAERAEQQARSEQEQAEQARNQALNEKKQADEEAYLAKEGTRLERAGIETLQRFKFDPAGALINAVRAGKDLEQLVQVHGVKKLEEYPAASPALALRTILDKIWQPPIVLQGPEGGVEVAQFSPNGQRIVTASYDGTARIWDLRGKELAVLEGHQNRVASAQFSPNGQRIVTASYDGTARIWNSEGTQLAILQDQGDAKDAQFSPDGRHIMTVFSHGQNINEGTARIWDSNGREVATLQEYQDKVGSARFSPDGQRIVTASSDGTARIWNLQGKELAILQHPMKYPLSSGYPRGYPSWVISAQFSPDGQRIITVSDLGGPVGGDSVRVWNSQGQELMVFQQIQGSVYDAQFSPDGQRIVTASSDGTARIWDLMGRELTALRHQSQVISAQFSPDGQRIVTASSDGVKIWDLNSGELDVLKIPNISTSNPQFSPDGQRIVTASDDGTARIWDLRDEKQLVLQHSSEVGGAQFSPNGQLIVTTSKENYDGIARIWNLDGLELANIRYRNTYVNINAQFSPDGCCCMNRGCGGAT